MKKIMMSVLLFVCVSPVLADDYTFLTFETADGTKTSISSSSLTITIKDGKLTAGTQTFTLADLSKMYFSADDESTTTALDAAVASLDNTTAIYDLQGRQVSKAQLKRGVYVMKTQSGTRKVNVK